MITVHHNEIYHYFFKFPYSFYTVCIDMLYCYGCYNSLIVDFVVVAITGHITVDHGYKPYDSGISQGVFIKVCNVYCMCYIILC